MPARTTSLSLLRLNTAWVDLTSGRVERPDETLHLTEQERRLLEYLVAHPSRTISSDELLAEVWGYADGVISRAPQIAMSRLRHKVDRREGRPEHIHTVWGEGYRFVPPGRARAERRPEPRPPPNRPAPGSSAQLVLLHDVVADLTRRLVFSGGQTMELTGVEAELLGYLAERPGKVITREELLRAVWGLHATTHARKLDTAVYRLRRKIEADPAHPRSLVTVRGKGYWLRLRRFDTSGPEPGLPAPRSSFFGRDRELAAIDALVRDGRRLVSLLGAGGVGKSRLALRYARGVAADRRRFPGGVRYCDVSGVEQTVDAAKVLGEVLDVTFMASSAPRPTAAGATGRILLVVDGFERLVPQAADILDVLLDAMPELTCVVTSRVRLGLDGERCVDVGVLTPEDARSLFADRVAAVAGAASSSLGAGARDAVLGHLGGHALAIELAAAQLRVQGLKEVLETIQHNLPELATGRPEGPERHQSVDACFRWSWERLGAREQIALSRCSVFGGAFSSEAAHAVIGTDGDARSASEVLGTLCDQGLVDVMSHPWIEGESRFQLIAPFRACAGRELDRSHRASLVRARFVTWLAGECEHLRFFARSNPELQPLARMAADRANIEAALRWARAEAPAAGVRLMAAIDILFLRRGPRAGWSQMTEQAWRLAEGDAAGAIDPSARSVLAVVRAEAGLGVRHRDDAADAARAAVTAAQEARSPGREARARLVLAEALGLLPEALRAVALAQEVDAQGVESAGWALAGVLHARAGDFEDAARARRRADELARSGDPMWWMVARSACVEIALLSGKRRQARDAADDVMRLARELGDRRAMTELTTRLAEDGLARGRFDEAHRHLLAARAAAELLDDPTSGARVAVAIGGLALVRGELGAARTALSEALKQLDDLGAALPLTRALCWSALVALAADRVEEAHELADEAVSVGGPDAFGARLVRAAAAVALGRDAAPTTGGGTGARLVQGLQEAHASVRRARRGEMPGAEAAIASARAVLVEGPDAPGGVLEAALKMCLERAVAKAAAELIKAAH